jgi:hypothetical protein
MQPAEEGEHKLKLVPVDETGITSGSPKHATPRRKPPRVDLKQSPSPTATKAAAPATGGGGGTSPSPRKRPSPLDIVISPGRNRGGLDTDPALSKRFAPHTEIASPCVLDKT